MKLSISDMQGKKLGEFDLDEKLLVFDKGQQVLHEALVAYQAHQRAGTASTLSKGEVQGTGAKPWKQKGLGRARAGYRQSPVWRGGSVAFGPRPRTYHKGQNRKAARLAFRRAFSEKVAAGAVEVIDALTVDSPKTKGFVQVLQNLKVEQAVLFVVENVEQNLALAARNVPGTEVTSAARLHTYELIRYPRIIITKDAMAVIQKRLDQGAGRSA